MNIVLVCIIVFSFILSTFLCLLVFERQKNKWLCMIIAFFVNTLLLSLMTIILYKVDVQTFHKQAEGVFGSLGILTLVFFIPILTCGNFYILKLVKKEA
ncbi:hypothetical protein ACFSCX_07150 [Bacillus salitolerans]|uniref:Group-specific protein n=1 Tax=Bacillus salitolerans TaxID=1437434 RepID=A0ABW4LMR6_9BACI